MMAKHTTSLSSPRRANLSVRIVFRSAVRRSIVCIFISHTHFSPPPHPRRQPHLTLWCWRVISHARACHHSIVAERSAQLISDTQNIRLTLGNCFFFFCSPLLLLLLLPPAFSANITWLGACVTCHRVVVLCTHIRGVRAAATRNGSGDEDDGARLFFFSIYTFFFYECVGLEVLRVCVCCWTHGTCEFSVDKT